MINYKNPEIRITLFPDHEPGIGLYCATVMDFDLKQGIWYNAGINCRADTPEEAFKEALDRFRCVELEE